MQGFKYNLGIGGGKDKGEEENEDINVFYGKYNEAAKNMLEINTKII